MVNKYYQESNFYLDLSVKELECIFNRFRRKSFECKNRKYKEFCRQESFLILGILIFKSRRINYKIKNKMEERLHDK